ncbi:MAG: hypothetical protein RLZZ312_1529 [Bacteroidota bacterium]|jgi:Uma2 family endonuclease
MASNFNFPKYTYNDYKNWKEDRELVDGYPLQLLPSASPKHSKTQARVIMQLGNSLSKYKDRDCTLFTKLDWKINEHTVIRPDIMKICDNQKKDYLEFPPLLVIEVLSPFNLKNDRVIKFDLYRENGVKFYIMVDCQNENVEVFELIDNFYKSVNKNKFLLDKNCEIELDFDALLKKTFYL